MSTRTRKSKKSAGTEQLQAAAAPAPSGNPVHARAMLVSLGNSAWTARKFDKPVTAELHRLKGAADGSGRYNKHLFAGEGKAHKEIIAAASAARNSHYEHTLPWGDDGWRLLPTANYTTYTDVMRAARSRFDSAVNDFVLEYPELIRKARRSLNGLFNQDDYPDPVAIRGKFGLDIEFNPIPDGSDFRLTLPQAEIEMIEQAVTARVQRATNGAMKDAWNRLGEFVERFHTRVTTNPDRLGDHLFESAGTLADLLERLNVAGDVELDRMCRRVRNELGTFKAQAVRGDENLRDSTAARAAAILQDMAGLYTPFGGAQ